jgi:uncharacterized RDD family membrane protein YckC
MDRELEGYVRDVLARIAAPAAEQARIEADLRAHLQEAVVRRLPDEPVSSLLARMGAPADVAAEFVANVRLHYAEVWQRLVAWMVDWLVIAFCAGPLIYLASLPLSAHSAGTGGSLVGRLVLIPLCRLLVIASVAAILAYFPVFEGHTGRTPGKEFLRLRVVRESGAPIGYKEALLRRLPLFLNVALLDALVALFSSRRQRAFDIIAHTVVIRNDDGSDEPTPKPS